MSQCHYLMMAGGTGGHIFPAMAVANQLKQQGAIVSWLGTSEGMEAQLVPAAGISLHTISIKGFRGKSALSKILAPLRLCKAIYQSIKIISQVKPNVVVGFGGFVAAPGGIAARLMGRPLLIHEQNSVAGSTNKLLAKLAQQSLEAFPHSLPKAIHVGNPVRESVVYLSKEKNTLPPGDNGQQPLRILITGGSLGAQAINAVVPNAMALMQSHCPIDIWHQTGKAKLLPVKDSYQRVGVDARIEEFIDDVATAYDWADVVICRAGALTVSEIAVAAIPAVFIPLPSAIDNHQFFNAKWLVDNHAALLIEQKDLTPELLSDVLQQLITDKKRLQDMQKKLQKVAMTNATQEVVNHCEKLCKEHHHVI